MKKMIRYLLSLTVMLFLLSCSDSVDIGSVKTIPNKPPEKPQESTIIEPDYVIWQFDEHYNKNKDEQKFYWTSTCKFIRNVIKIDTANAEPVFYFDLEVESSIPDKSIKDRDDRITSFKMKIDSLVMKDKIYVTEFSIPKISTGLSIKNLKDNNPPYYYTSNSFMFNFFLNKESNGVIKGTIIIEFFNLGFQTNLFEGFIEIKYAEKKNK